MLKEQVSHDSLNVQKHISFKQKLEMLSVRKDGINMKKIISLLCMCLILTIFGSTNVNVFAADSNVKSIKIKTMPDKLTYNVGDGYSTNGIVVEATLSDGKKETVDNAQITSFSGVTLTEGRPFTMEGYKTVELQYNGAKTTYGIAIFDPNKEYFVTYNTDGGSAIEPHKIDASTKAFTLPKASKKGYKFLGWYDSNGTKYTKYVPGMGTNVQLQAKWGAGIIFKANGGKGKMKDGVLSDNYELPKSGFKRSGYKFVGWSTQKVVKDIYKFYEVGTPASDIYSSAGNVTLYAQWVKSKTYKITYVSVKGVKIPAKAIKKYTSGKKTMLPIPKTTGFKRFAGWTITVNGKKIGQTMEIPPYVTGNIKVKPFLSTFEG